MDPRVDADRKVCASYTGVISTCDLDDDAPFIMLSTSGSMRLNS